ncbi:glycosyltransferase [Rossellomorea aquimaris]|uniref:Glycosyltransferase n=1 Tax=Rossellomorea aquimaris TaxID=189382 RepID=A0A5D4TW34_9BACI|nr:glycosyltransferase [Rossellomorea aquimaris]TYS79118.1 glycosyltransferase [Rossellomorea aquimaris]TYS84864.1 glycosyltransferase [Rossellomorea aquimaris]
MKVSIIIPFYNCAYIDQAIQSALRQTYKDIEVIVVDDGSTQYVEKIQPFKNRIKYIRKSNGGTASALNAGLRQATGKYFAWLSSDDMFLESKIARQLAYMNSIGSKVSYTAFKTIDINNNVVNEIHSRRMNRNTFQSLLLKACPVNGCTVMAEIDSVKQAGWFDERLKYTQDYEMWCRLSLYTKMDYLDEVLVLYRVHSSMGSAKHGVGMVKESQYIQRKYQTYFKMARKKY